MKYISIFLVCASILVLFYCVVSLYSNIRASQSLISTTEPFVINSEDYTTTLLVLGDSTAVGVGATLPSESIPGRLASYIGATYVENLAVSGARTADLFEQKTQVTRASYTYILVQIGGNDIIRFKSAKKSAQELERVLSDLPNSAHLIVLSAGNVGAAQFFPRVLRPLHARLNRAYHESFDLVVRETGGMYINLYADPSLDPFVFFPERYLADDGLHPSSDGYEVWFLRIVEKLSQE